MTSRGRNLSKKAKQHIIFHDTAGLIQEMMMAGIYGVLLYSHPLLPAKGGAKVTGTLASRTQTGRPHRCCITRVRGAIPQAGGPYSRGPFEAGGPPGVLSPGATPPRRGSAKNKKVAVTSWSPAVSKNSLKYDRPGSTHFRWLRRTSGWRPPAGAKLASFLFSSRAFIDVARSFFAPTHMLARLGSFVSDNTSPPASPQPH